MTFYRYKAERYASMNDDSVMFRLSPTITLSLYTYNLHKETPKGYWIGYGHPDNGYNKGDSFWVSKTAKKRYAYPTKQEALTNYIKRTERRIGILQNQLDYSQDGLRVAIKKQKELENEIKI